MAIKKCDDIVVEAEALETEGAEGTTEEAAAEGAAEAEDTDFQGFEAGDGANETAMGSDNLHAQGQEAISQMTAESALEAIQDGELARQFNKRAVILINLTHLCE